ncbi:protein NLRC3-like isoform X2 [Dysidea avara]|uniref:protein NLRC3-like isoform X2 n=1 Tax=Dysidea avara TaxID=196820 RepID=UPI00332A9E98
MADRNNFGAGLSQFTTPEKAINTPLLKDLHNYITPNYAAHWRVIGALLGLSSGTLDIIKYDNHDKAESSCDAMLEKWLEVDPSASWENLLKVIESPAVSHDSSSDKQEVSVFSNIMSKRNVQGRFRVDDDAWPPDQPKNFTPLLLIHYKGHHNLQQALAITKLAQTGDIASLVISQSIPKRLKLDHDQPLQEVLATSTVTEEIEQVLALLEKNDEPQFILVEGPPGIGKSVLLKEIAYRWGDKQVLKVFKFVLLLCLRDPIVQQSTSVHELLQLFCVGHKRAPEIIDVCNDYLFENGGKDIILLLDGFDEFPADLQKNSLISNILKRHVLPECGLIVSSRPHASENLHKQATLRIDILGFTESERMNYIKQALPHAIKELTEYLESNHTINGLCLVPFNMVILIYLYKQGIPLPSNSTQLYHYFICLTICRHLSRSGHLLEKNITHLTDLPEPCNTVIHQLSKLSLEGLSNNKLIFTLEEVTKTYPDILAVPGAINGFGLLQAVKHFTLTGKTMTFNFIHFSVQEFLAAYHVSLLSPHEELQVLKEKFWSDLHSNMFAMYTSLTKGQRFAFKQFLSCGNDTITVSEIFLQDQLKCLQLFYCFHGAEDKTMCEPIQKAKTFETKIIDLSHTSLSPYDVDCIATFLTCSLHKGWKTLSLYFCHIQDYHLRVLHRGLTKSDVTITKLDLSWNDLSHSSSSSIKDLTIHCKVEELLIRGNDYIGEDHALYSMLAHPSSRLLKLDMNYTRLSSTSAFVLFTELALGNKLQHLDINDNDITDEICDAIATLLNKNTSLVRLSMSGNQISVEAAQRLAQAVHLRNRKLSINFW